jgi:CRP-like cAMP-binding protein
VSSFLVLLSHRVGSEDDNMVDVQMSRQDIADYLGLRIETVCRVLSDLKRAGMLDIPNQHQLILKDVDGLSELADSIE